VQQIEGFLQDNVTASQTNVEVTRAWGRFKTPRAGTVTGLLAMLEASQVRTAGTLTIALYYATIDATTGVRSEVALGVTAVLNSTNLAYAYSAADADVPALAEVYPKITTDSGWTPTTADLKVSFLFEA